jgi:hypothetical protein
MSVGFKTAYDQLVRIVQGETPKSQPAKRFSHRTDRDLDDEATLEGDRLFWLTALQPPRRGDSYTGPVFRVQMMLQVLYAGSKPDRQVAMASEDLGLLQLALMLPANHGGPNVTGIMTISPPTASQFRRRDGGAIAAALTFDLHYQETNP